MLGAGLLGLAAGFYLKSFLPHKEIVIVEEEGIPSEQGITHVSPGIFAAEAASSLLIKRKHWIRKVLQNLEYETGIKRSGAHFFNKSTIVKFGHDPEKIFNTIGLSIMSFDVPHTLSVT